MDAKSIPVWISERRQFACKVNARNSNNLVQLKYAPVPASPPPFAMFLCNARSVRYNFPRIEILSTKKFQRNYLAGV